MCLWVFLSVALFFSYSFVPSVSVYTHTYTHKHIKFVTLYTLLQKIIEKQICYLNIFLPTLCKYVWKFYFFGFVFILNCMKFCCFILEEVMATHSSILAWRSPMDRGAWKATYSPWGCKELDVTE